MYAPKGTKTRDMWQHLESLGFWDSREFTRRKEKGHSAPKCRMLNPPTTYVSNEYHTPLLDWIMDVSPP
jgi:hypothetical protein